MSVPSQGRKAEFENLRESPYLFHVPPVRLSTKQTCQSTKLMPHRTEAAKQHPKKERQQTLSTQPTTLSLGRFARQCHSTHSLSFSIHLLKHTRDHVDTVPFQTVYGAYLFHQQQYYPQHYNGSCRK